MAKKHRLFKVARELNTGSSTLVDYLNDRGFEVENNLNASLSEEMYGLLVKEFASAKELKKKAEQIKEKKREERLNKGSSEESTPEENEEILSAADLKKGILDTKSKLRKLRPMPKPRAEKAAPPVEKKAEPVQPKEVPAQEEKKPVSAETPPEVVAEKESSSGTPDNKVPGLKVKGKIDLSQFERKKKGKNEKREEKGKSAEKKAPPAKKPEVKTPATPKVEKQAPPKEEQKAPATPPPAKQPIAESKPAPKQETKPPVEKKAEEKAAPAKIEAKTEEKKEGESVIKASDHSPQLRGLKVLGKIDLGDSKKTKSKSDSSNSDDPEKKKRRRKRKRKKSTAVSTDNRNQKPGTNRGGGGGRRRNDRSSTTAKKEEPTDKEIKDKIKETLTEIERRASRSRQNIRRGKRDKSAARRQREEELRQRESQILEVTEFITANEFANLMKVPVTQLITKCMEIGMFVSINQRLDSEIIELLAEEYGFQIRFIDITETDDIEEEEVDDPKDLKPRAPIVTVMGHVDHGKTSLLDFLRDANVIAGEAGGITQHIGAYEVKLEDERKVTFLDTPGHEAFTAMRARGAKVTDVVIIVVAADDNVMPQTKEAINHAEAAGVPMVFALNKMDKPAADPDRIRTQLSENNILLEDWGGKFQSQEISAKFGTGVDDLLEKVLLEAEMLELKANPDKPARGTVVEARLDKGRGVVATLLVQEGTLKVGDAMVAGIHFGRVRAMMDERGKRIKQAGPSTPVQILGLPGAPQAGDRFIIYEDEKQAKDIAQKRNELYREQSIRQTKRRSLEELGRMSKTGEIKDLNIIIKGDVDGSIEALSDSLLKLSMEEVEVNVVRKAVGQISEADVLLASASEAIIIGFQVRPSLGARRLAEEEGIDIRLYSIIYDAINDVRDALEGMLSPDVKEEIMGSAEIREVFRISKVGNIAGCMVLDGNITRKDPVRLIRDGIVIYTGKLSSLKRFKDDVREVKSGFEMGTSIDGYNDIKVGDVIEQYRETEVKRTLN